MTGAQYVLAMAYIARHSLDFKWKKVGDDVFCLVATSLDRPRPQMFVGHGTDLYSAVLDYQEKSGIGFGG